MSSKLTLADVQIVVERRGPGPAAWWWRLIRDRPGANLSPLGESEQAYRSAQCAYDAATASLRMMQRTIH